MILFTLRTLIEVNLQKEFKYYIHLYKVKDIRTATIELIEMYPRLRSSLQ